MIIDKWSLPSYPSVLFIEVQRRSHHRREDVQLEGIPVVVPVFRLAAPTISMTGTMVRRVEASVQATVTAWLPRLEDALVRQLRAY
jgi:hypothetical protein